MQLSGDIMLLNVLYVVPDILYIVNFNNRRYYMFIAYFYQLIHTLL